MTFGNKTLKTQIKGACCFEEDGKYLSCFHYSKEQFNYFASSDRGWNMRSHFSCGIRMEFKTDATALSFDYRINDAWSQDNTLDAYCDGFAVAVHRISGDGKGHVDFTLPAGEKMVTVYFPSDCRFEIKSVTINGTYKSVKDKGEKLLIIGDSISQGYGTFMSGATYINALQRRTGYTILNQGIGGYRYDAGSVMPIEGFDPDKILVSLGTNYYDSPNYDYESDVIRFYEKLHEVYGDRPVISVTPYWRCQENFDSDRLNWCIGIIKRECAKYPNISVIEGYSILPHIDEVFCDGLHPNAYGASIIAETLASFMKKIKF